jgi:hypothetical protein
MLHHTREGVRLSTRNDEGRGARVTATVIQHQGLLNTSPNTMRDGSGEHCDLASAEIEVPNDPAVISADPVTASSFGGNEIR